MTVPQGVANVLRAIVSAMVNAHERGSLKVPRLAEPAHQYGQLKYRCHHQVKTHGRHGEGVTFATLSASCATSYKETCACVAIMA